MTTNIVRVLITFLIAVCVFAVSSFGQTKSKPPTQSAIPKSSAEDNETLIYNALRQIHAAQATYNATTGNGSYALTLQELADLEFIDQILGRGEKYGYYFWVAATPTKNNKPSFFTATATPSQYPKTGRRSFYIDSNGVVRGADKNGAIATVNDPFFIICGDNESEIIQSLRTLHSAEITYQATAGAGNFGTFQNLQSHGLIDSLTAQGNRCGYRFTVIKKNGFSNNSASFYIAAVPQKYPVTGRRSFRIDHDGVIRGADRKGQPANADDLPIEL